MPVTTSAEQAAEAAAELPGPDTGALNTGEKVAAAAAVPDEGGTLAVAALDRARKDRRTTDSPQDVIDRASAYLAWLKEQG